MVDDWVPPRAVTVTVLPADSWNPLYVVPTGTKTIHGAACSPLACPIGAADIGTFALTTTNQIVIKNQFPDITGFNGTPVTLIFWLQQ